uniref:Uncharacterized protein n=1 Tax=Panagrolaimus sp. PS1159 TaxID=55785 RepID=A0AC35G8H3_9BILA
MNKIDYEEILKQLRRFMFNDEREIEWLENESKDCAEHSIKDLAIKAGFKSTAEMLKSEFSGFIFFVKKNVIKAKTKKLYASSELQDILSLQKRTTKKPAAKNKRVRRFGNGGGRYQSQFNISRTTPKLKVTSVAAVTFAAVSKETDRKRPTINKSSVIMTNIHRHLS